VGEDVKGDGRGDKTSGHLHGCSPAGRALNANRVTVRRVHVGILGGGNISVTHARAAAAAGCRIAAVWGQNAGKAAAIAREHGAPSFDDLDRFLAHRPMDLIAIGSPSDLHATRARAHHVGCAPAPSRSRGETD
jgi:GFO/IDH/MocA oxidoreductase family protein